MRRRRKKPYGKIAILCIATLLLSYGMGKYFESLYLKYADYGGVQPVITNPTDNTNSNEKNGGDESQEKIFASSQGFSVYLIQNGVYSVEGGAKSQAALLELDGFKACVFYEDHYRIVSGIYLDKEKALSQIEKQRDLGFENFLLEVEVPDFLIEVSLEEEKEKVELILSKLSKSVSIAQRYFDKNGVYQTMDVANITYQGQDEKVLDILRIIESYSDWEVSQDGEKGNAFLGNLSKYLRSIG